MHSSAGDTLSNKVFKRRQHMRPTTLNNARRMLATFGKALTPAMNYKNSLAPSRLHNCLNSPAARDTKKHVYLPYRRAIPFWFYHVPLR